MIFMSSGTVSDGDHMRTCIYVLLLVCGCAAACAQSADRYKARDIELSVNVIEQPYCRVDDEVNSVRLKFRIAVTNRGGEEISVPENAYPIAPIARTLDDLERGKVEFELRPPEKFPPDSAQGDNDESRYVERVIEPRETKEIEAEVSLVVTRLLDKVPKDALAPGTHFLRLTFPILRWSDRRLQKYTDVTSKPIEVYLMLHSSAPACEKGQ